MKRWRKAVWIFSITLACFFSACIWAVKSRSELVFEKDQYWKQMLGNTPFVSKKLGPYTQYLKWCNITETGTLKGLRKTRMTSGPLDAEVTETWHGPCYVEISVDGKRQVIWGKKLVKVEHTMFHSVKVTIE